MTLRRKQREAAMEAILDAAARVFAEHGYHGASMEEVARASGCAPATLYGYFKGKQPLFARMCDGLMTAFGEGAAGAILGGGTYQQAFDDFVEFFIHFVEENRALIQVVISLHRSPETGTAPDPEQAQEARVAYLQLVSSLMQRGIDEGVLMEANPTDLAVCFLGLMHTAAVNLQLDGAPDPLRPVVTFAVDMFRRGAARRTEA
jgi:TetR/AcrR family fatty acid metabolism transcriptional regulator